MGRAKEVSAYCERYITETHSERPRGRVACATRRAGYGVTKANECRILLNRACSLANRAGLRWLSSSVATFGFCS